MGASIRCDTFKIIIKQRRRKETRINNEHERRIKCGLQSYSWISCAVSDGESILSWLIQWNLLNNSVPTSGSAENKNPNTAWKQFWNDWNDKEHSDNRKDRGTMEGSSTINSSNSSRSGIYFSAMHAMKTNFCNGKPSSLASIVIGASARCIAGSIMIPATVIKVRCESGMFQYRGIGEAFQKIY